MLPTRKLWEAVDTAAIVAVSWQYYSSYLSYLHICYFNVFEGKAVKVDIYSFFLSFFLKKKQIWGNLPNYGAFKEEARTLILTGFLMSHVKPS